MCFGGKIQSPYYRLIENGNHEVRGMKGGEIHKELVSQVKKFEL